MDAPKMKRNAKSMNSNGHTNRDSFPVHSKKQIKPRASARGFFIAIGSRPSSSRQDGASVTASWQLLFFS